MSLLNPKVVAAVNSVVTGAFSSIMLTYYSLAIVTIVVNILRNFIGNTTAGSINRLGI